LSEVTYDQRRDLRFGDQARSRDHAQAAPPRKKDARYISKPIHLIELAREKKKELISSDANQRKEHVLRDRETTSMRSRCRYKWHIR